MFSPTIIPMATGPDFFNRLGYTFAGFRGPFGSIVKVAISPTLFGMFGLSFPTTFGKLSRSRLPRIVNGRVLAAFQNLKILYPVVKKVTIVTI